MQEGRRRTLIPAALEATGWHGVIGSIAVALQDAVRHEIPELDLLILVGSDDGAPGKTVETRGFRGALPKAICTVIDDIAVRWEAKDDLTRGETGLCPGVVSGCCVQGWLTGVSTSIVQRRIRTRGVRSYEFSMQLVLPRSYNFVRTFKIIVIHDQDPIDELGETRRIFDRVAVGASEWSVLNSSRYFSSQRERLPKELNESKHVICIVRAFGVVHASLSRVLPIDVDAIEVVLLVNGKDIVDEGEPIGRSRYSFREIPGGA